MTARIVTASLILALIPSLSPFQVRHAAATRTVSMDMMNMGCRFLTDPNAMPAFCDTFDNPSPGGRGGDLDASKWSFSRLAKRTNPGQGLVNAILPTDAMHCQTLIHGVTPDHDSFFCGMEVPEPEHWMTAMNDGGDDFGYQLSEARARQPFDFANRTGIITELVDAKTAGGGTWWTAIWITQDPEPAPEASTKESGSIPRNGIGLIFDNECGTGGGQMSLGQSFAYTNYVERDINVVNDSCVSTADDSFNHIEVRINQQRVEVWASDNSPDHGMTSPNFRMIAHADNLNLPFTRGYVHFEHAQINGAKFGVTSQQTYHWSDLGFDGPKLPMERGYEVPDALTQVDPSDPSAGTNVGYIMADSPDGQTVTCCSSDPGVTTVPVDPFPLANVDLQNVASARLNFNVWLQGNLPDGSMPVVHYRFNGGPWRSYAYPMSLNIDLPSPWRTYSVPVSLSDLRQGTNTVEFYGQPADDGFPIVIANVDLTLLPKQ